MKNLSFLCAFIALFMIVALSGCTQTTPGSQNPVNTTVIRTNEVVTITNTGTNCTMLLAGQTINAGNVCLEDIDTNGDYIDDTLVVTYTTTGGWELVEVHFWIGTALSQMPVTRTGNPIPGHFPYSSGNITGQTTYSFNIPFSAFGFNCDNTLLYAAAHAALRKLKPDGTYQTETGWGNGERIVAKGNWATYFTFRIKCDSPPPEPDGCETVFANGGASALCFINDLDFHPWNIPDGTFERWGWTNGPLAPGSYIFNLYAGAAHCDVSRGTLVGTLTVVYASGTANVTYTMNPGFSLNETHLYVGSDILPKHCKGSPGHPNYECDWTVAPGQFPYKHNNLGGATSDSYTVAGLSGNIFVVAHAVACGPGLAN